MSDTGVKYTPGDAADKAWLKTLTEKAGGGDPASLARPREFLDENPQLWQKIGHLGSHARASWVKLIAGGNLLLSESITREADRLKSELLAGQVSPVERMLVDQIVAQYIELEYYRARAAESPGSTRGQVTSLQRQLDGSQRRFLEAMKALELIRKLAAPPGDAERFKVFRAEGTA